MVKSASRKLKALYIAKILLEETDDERGLTMPQIIEHLAKQGIKAERKAVYDDIAQLREFGLDIITRQGLSTEYAIGERDFEFPELLLLVDAVQSSRFLTNKKSDALVERIKGLTSKNLAQQLSKRVYVEGRIKMQNESIYYCVDAIQEAIQQRRKISFHYFEYDFDKKHVYRHDGDTYTETPVCLIYTNDYYYLVVFSDTYNDFTRYRVDRMLDIKLLDEHATRNDRIANFDSGEFSLRSFGMFDGESVSANLMIDRSIVGAIIDRFGKDVSITKIDETRAVVHVVVLSSEVLFGWLAQFGNKIHIESPLSLAEDYASFLKAILRTY